MSATQPAAGTCPGEQDASGAAVDAPRQSAPTAQQVNNQKSTLKVENWLETKYLPHLFVSRTNRMDLPCSKGVQFIKDLCARREPSRRALDRSLELVECISVSVLSLWNKFVRQVLEFTGSSEGIYQPSGICWVRKKKPIAISCKEGKANHLNFKAGEVQLSKQ